MRRSIWITCVLVIVMVAASLLLPACKPKVEETQFKVALLTSGPVSDAGWNAAAYDGLKAIETALGASVSNTETKAPAEYEEAMRSYASQGYDLIFAHGYEYQDAAKKVGAEFPNTVFVVTSGTEGFGTNVSPLIFLEEQGYYIMGLVAAKVSKTGKLGLIGAEEIPALVYPYKGFELGAKTANPDIQITTSWIGTWEDVGKAKEATIALINAGCDVVFGCADQATLGILQAAKENNVYTYGAYSDQIALAPDVIIGEFMLSMQDAFVATATKVQAGTFEGGTLALGLADGAISFTWNDPVASKLPAEVKAAADQALADLKSGALKIPAFSLGEE